MPKITIDLDLGPAWEQNPETGEFYPIERDQFDEQIINRVVDAFASRLDYEGRRKLDEAVIERADKLITERLDAEITKVIAGPLQKYDYMGKPQGEAFTVNEMVVKAVEEFASAHGRNRDTYGGRKEPATNLAQLVDDVVQAALREDLANDVRAIRNVVVAEIKTKLQNEVATAVTTPSR